MKKILIISYGFPPAGGPGVQRLAKFVRYLPEQGWLPTVLAAAPGENNPGDESLLAEIPVMVKVHRQPGFGLPGWLNKRFGRAAARLLLWPGVNRNWARRMLPVASRLLEDDSYEAILSTDPPASHWLGLQLKRKYKLPWIVDIRDLWTGAFTYRPASYIHGRLDTQLEKQILSAADRVICATAGYPQVLQRMYPGISAERYHVIPNGFDSTDFKLQPEITADTFRLTYVGSLFDFSVRPRAVGWKRFFEPITSGGPATAVRSPEIILKSIAYLLQRRPDAVADVRIRFVGSFPEKYLGMITDLQLEKVVELSGYVDHSLAIHEMQAAAILIIMQDGPGSEVVIPGKLYEYLRSGRLILGLFPSGLSAELIKNTGAGVVIPPTDFRRAGEQLLEWYQLWKAGRLYSRSEWDTIECYERKNQTAILAALLDKLIQ